MIELSNFSAGPAALPAEVEQELRDATHDFLGTGIPVWSISHRHPKFDWMMEQIVGLVRELLNVPPDYSIVFLPGGATTQFKAWVMNVPRQRPTGPRIGYVDSGHWSREALTAGRELEAAGFCTTMVIASAKAEGYRTMPDLQRDLFGYTATLDFTHVVTNETVNGTQMNGFPTSGWGLRPRVIADMSSDIMSRPIPVQAFGYIYAGVQKNLGISGATLVIVRNDLYHEKGMVYPASLDLSEQIRVKNGLRNTPATIALASVYYMLRWIKEQGGVAEMERRARERAFTLYDAIDASTAFEELADPVDRSVMNVVFRLRDQSRQVEFLRLCAQERIEGIKGHVAAEKYYGPHLRASLYNGQTMTAVRRLIEVMDRFERRNQ